MAAESPDEDTPGDGSAAATPRRAGAFHGRRRGKALRREQADRLAEGMPRLRIALDGPIADPRALFPHPVSAVHLEIGFGGGEHLLARAAEAPDVGFIGAEPFINGVAKLVRAIEGHGLRNLRLHDDEVTPLLQALPAASLDRVYLLYPDPWPKRRQRKRRLVSDERLAALARVLKPGAEFRFASDIDDYVGWTLARVLRSPDFHWPAMGAVQWRQPWPGWPGTRYEAKALAAGRTPSYLTFLRR
jgi:tRNA (guanine-N7-)-methyltransferase